MPINSSQCRSIPLNVNQCWWLPDQLCLIWHWEEFRINAVILIGIDLHWSALGIGRGSLDIHVFAFLAQHNRLPSKRKVSTSSLISWCVRPVLFSSRAVNKMSRKSRYLLFALNAFSPLCACKLSYWMSYTNVQYNSNWILANPPHINFIVEIL